MHAHERLRIAAKLYVVTEKGEVQGPNGPRAINLSQDGYPRFGHLFEDGVRTVMVHRLVAYQKFGEALFAEGIQVRHLDGNSKNFRESNIAIGTASENMMDRPATTRKRIAVAAATQRRALTDAEVLEIRRRKRAGETLLTLAKEYDVQKSTLSYIVRGVTYRHLPV